MLVSLRCSLPTCPARYSVNFCGAVRGALCCVRVSGLVATFLSLSCYLPLSITRSPGSRGTKCVAREAVTPTALPPQSPPPPAAPENDLEAAYSLLCHRARTVGLKTGTRAMTNGNSQFRAIAMAQLGDEDKHLVVRAALVLWLRQHPNEPLQLAGGKLTPREYTRYAALQRFS